MEFVIEDSAPTQAEGEYAIVPSGVHQMTIRAASEGPNEYKRTDENPEGMCLKLRLSAVEGRYSFVFHDIPKHLGWMAKQLADAVGLIPIGGKLVMDPDDLVNQTVTVEISHYTSKAGKTTAQVKRYVPLSEVAPAKPAKKVAARTPAAKVAAVGQGGADDDIPF